MTNMSPFRLSLEKLENHLRKKNFHNYSLLQKPLADEEILNYLEKLDIKDENIYNLYKWKNGINIDEVKSMIFEFQITILSLQNVYYYNERNKADRLIDDGFVMLFSNGEDAFLFNNNTGKDYGKIYLNMNVPFTIENPLPYYDSFKTMLETTNALYEADALYFDKEVNFLDSDTENASIIYSKFNPISDFFNRNQT